MKPNVMYQTDHPAYKKLGQIGKEITTKVKPKAVVVFSAHWQAGRDTIQVNTAEITDLIYEYVSFFFYLSSCFLCDFARGYQWWVTRTDYRVVSTVSPAIFTRRSIPMWAAGRLRIRCLICSGKRGLRRKV